MLDILEWTLDVIGVTYRRLDGRYWHTYVTVTDRLYQYLLYYLTCSGSVEYIAVDCG